MMKRGILPALVLFGFAAHACSSSGGAQGGSADAGADGGAPTADGGGGETGADGRPDADAAIAQDAAPPLTPSSYLLITKERLATLRATASASNPRWATLKTNVDANLSSTTLGSGESSPENAATVYLFTQDAKYAALAYAWAHALVAAADVRSDSYLAFGDDMRQVALVLNYCFPALTAAQQTELEGYLDQWTDELWNHNQGSGWGLADPGNNYHLSFLEGTAFAGYALRETGGANAAAYLAILQKQLTAPAPEGEMAYVNGVALGGEWIEGSNYGERSKERMFMALAAVATMDGTSFFTQSPFFANAISFQIYGTQPGHQYFYCGGDLARDSTMPISPYDRAIVQLATYFVGDAAARADGQGFLTGVIPDYTGPSFDDRPDYYLDFLFGLDQASTPEDGLPLSYQAASSGWVNLRSGWDAHATSVTVSGTPFIDQSHQHDDVGSFVLWHDGWLAGDASVWSHSGEIQTSDAHNMIHVAGADHDVKAVPGMTQFHDETAYGYVQVDGSKEFATSGAALLGEWTRELVYLRAQDAVVVYDRVAPANGQAYDWRLHFPTQPTTSGTAYTASSQGASIALQPVSGGVATVTADSDLSDPATSYRVQETPAQTPGRLLNLVAVATGAAPDVTAQYVTGSHVEGVMWRDQVVIFSSYARGVAAGLPLSYTVPGTAVLTHTLTNLPMSAVDATVTYLNGQTTVTVSAGSTYTPSAAGTLQITM
jgi:hypothetical protein